MKTTVQIEGGVRMEMEVAEDCVVFFGRCLCHAIRKNGERMVEEAKAVGKSKIVIVGDCDDHEQRHDEILAEVMTSGGMEYVWLSETDTFIHCAMPDYSEMGIRRFSEAENFGKLRLLLKDVGRKVFDVQQKIEAETKLLAEYSVVAKIESIESHDHNHTWNDAGRAAWQTLFGAPMPSTLVSEVNAVMLLDPNKKSGLLVTKSQQIAFTLARPNDFKLDTLRGRIGKDGKLEGYMPKGYGSVRINVGSSSPEISVYCKPGVWFVAPHPPLYTLDPDIHYKPMWQRVCELNVK